MAEGFAPPRGTSDLLPPRSEALLAVQERAADLARSFGYRYVETPAFDHTEVFERTSGETSDVVSKEMYTFEDKGGRSLTLKPEGTAPVVRAFLGARHDLPSPFKGFYLERMWRYDRPQAGRMREFHQFGVEVIGTDAAAADAEVIVVGHRFLTGQGLSDLRLRLNSIGDEVCRPAYREALLAYLREHAGDLTDEHRTGFEANPMRVLDCKDEHCRRVAQDAPAVTDFLCDACRVHFDAVQRALDGEGIAYELDHRLVRGLDYYTRTAFEFQSIAIGGAQGTLCGGGRYDGLAEVLGGEPTPGVGFGLGLDRVLLAMEAEGLELPVRQGTVVHLVAIGEAARQAVARLARSLRDAGVAATTTFGERPLGAQLRDADRSGARYAAIVGEREVSARVVTIRRLADGEQDEVPEGEVLSWLASRV